ncbi:MAG: hypothetical protein HKN91_07730 [Acidimicrobiia bacterium]|nr:hypothetical protein [Acidimicrobiia bacterium]
MNLLITGGEQRRPRTITAGSGHWYKYARGRMLNVDAASGLVSNVMSYESPPEVVADEEPAVLFKQGTLDGDRLYLTTQTEVIVYSYPQLEILHYISLPQFNDVHHVRPTSRGTLLVVNTGLDQVLELDFEGTVLKEWNSLGKDPWERFDRETDYRKVSSTKPYESHPNHVFTIDDEVFVTRFKQKDAVSVEDPSRRIDIGVERVHDGVAFGDHIYFTAVNGHIAVVDKQTLQTVDMFDLAEIESSNHLLGWCRGIAPDEEGAWVGFSRLRPTAVRENIAWVKSGFRKSMGTHIARYNLKTRTLEQRIELEEHDFNAVFSIFPI